jgi:hypothetical protein
VDRGAGGRRARAGAPVGDVILAVVRIVERKQVVAFDAELDPVVAQRGVPVEDVIRGADDGVGQVATGEKRVADPDASPKRTPTHGSEPTMGRYVAALEQRRNVGHEMRDAWRKRGERR